MTPSPHQGAQGPIRGPLQEGGGQRADEEELWRTADGGWREVFTLF